MNGGVYCTTFGGRYDLDAGWKCDKDNVVSLFKRADMKHVEFLNLKGSDLNDNSPWDVEVVEALITMLERDKSRVYLATCCMNKTYTAGLPHSTCFHLHHELNKLLFQYLD